MLKVFTLLMALCLSTTVVMAQNTKKEKAKQAKAELKEKASKAARKEAKRLTKEGWRVAAGALPLEKQLDRSFQFELDVDDDMNPLYVQGEGRSTASSYDAAKLQAIEVARQQLVSKISSETTAMVDNLVANKQLEADQAASITTTMSEGKTIFSQKLGRVLTVLEIEREIANKNKEVEVRVFTKQSEVEKIARDAIRETLEQKGMQMSEELKDIMSKKK